jgi:Domain of unknown function (DUF4148)
MKTTRILALTAFTAAFALAGAAHADALTRNQVQAEALEAARTGDVFDYEMGKKLKELYPGAYPEAVKRTPALPRTVVKAPTDIEQQGTNQPTANTLARREPRGQQMAAGQE